MNAARVVFASGNAGKLRELRELLGTDWVVVPQAELGIDPAAETGASFAANALLKARHAARCSGLPALADDSGIEVDALDGAPGVYSARYAGPDATDADNVARLLGELRDVPDEGRTARFRCVLAWVNSADDPDPLFAEGCWEGRIAHAPAGVEGFGYDPVFVDPGSGLTAAELGSARKNARSHRARALRALRERLAAGAGSGARHDAAG